MVVWLYAWRRRRRYLAKASRSGFCWVLLVDASLKAFLNAFVDAFLNAFLDAFVDAFIDAFLDAFLDAFSGCFLLNVFQVHL